MRPLGRVRATPGARRLRFLWSFPLLVLLGAVLVSTLFAAENPLPKGLPPYGPLKPFTPPKVEQKKLGNGLTVWLVPEKDFPKIAFSVAIRGGLASDPKNRPGLAEFLVSLVNEGTRSRSSKAINEQIQAAGGDFSLTARADAMLVSTEVLASKLDQALAVVSDVLQNATIPDDEVEIVRQQLADNLRANEARPEFVGGRALAKAIFGEHPYSVVAGTLDSIAATTPAELRQEYGRRFRPDQAVLVAVGDFSPDRMFERVERAFSSWKSPETPAVKAVPDVSGMNPHAIFVLPRTGSVQTTLMFGVLGPNRAGRDYAAAQVATAIFGGMFGSRLIRNIREEKGYSYTPFAMLQERSRTGVFRSQADVRNEVTGASYNEMQYELNRMATTKPEAGELERAQRYLVGNKALELQSRGSVASQFATLWVDGLPPEELGQESERIQTVTADQVAEVGRKYYPAARSTVVAVGEREVVDSQLRLFGAEFQPPYQPAPEKP